MVTRKHFIEPGDDLAADTCFIAARDCPLLDGGTNLALLRRPRLREIAKELKLDPGGSKNAIVQRIMHCEGFTVRKVRWLPTDQFMNAQREVISP